MENTILSILFLLVVFSIFGFADLVMGVKNWYFRKPAHVGYWSAYERN